VRRNGAFHTASVTTHLPENPHLHLGLESRLKRGFLSGMGDKPAWKVYKLKYQE